MQPKDKLRRVALEQAGYFTAAQATEAGYPDSLHVYHAREGHWEKVQRGIYRLVDIPKPDWPELIIWSLWSRDAKGNPQIVYTHETAEQIHGIRPRTDGKLHATVPRSFRKNCAIPEGIAFYKADIDDQLIEQRTGFRVLALSLMRTCSAPADYNRVIDCGED